MSIFLVMRILVFSTLVGLLVGGCSSLTKRRPLSSDSSKQITVPGSRAWTPTGIIVKQADRIQIRASGAISNNPKDTGRDPNGNSDKFRNETRHWNPQPSANDLSLIGRIGNVLFAVGSEKELLAPADGEIFLGVNDNIVSDNAGAWNVSVTLSRP